MTTPPLLDKASDGNAFASPDPTTATAVVEATFFARLVEVTHSSAALFGDAGIEAGVRDRLAQVDQQLAQLVANDMDRANVHYVALAVAAVDILEPVCTRAKAAAIVDDCLNSPLRPWVLKGTSAMLDGADDPFAALVAVSKEREASYFGASFTFARPVDDDTTYILDIVRCLFHEALKAAGRVELQPILCRFDLNWVDAIDPERHRQRFVRPVTFASGNVCRMCFLRLEQLPGLVSVPPPSDAPAQR